MNAYTNIDLRAFDAKERGNKPEPEAIPFDLTGCSALIQAIKPYSDTIRERANERERAVLDTGMGNG